MIVPALAFSEKGFRLGYGKGFYDRILQKFKGTSIGVTFDALVLPEIPHEDHDCPVHCVITEKRVINLLSQAWHGDRT